LTLEEKPRTVAAIKTQIERDIIDPRGHYAWISGLDGKDQPQNISKLFATSAQPKKEFLEGLLTQMASKITDEQLGDLDKLKENLGQIIKYPEGAAKPSF
jgi:hypothetical protein